MERKNLRGNAFWFIQTEIYKPKQVVENFFNIFSQVLIWLTQLET